MSVAKLMSLGAVAGAFLLSACLTETEIQERNVYIGGPDTALLAKEGQTLNLKFFGKFGADTLKTARKYLTAGGDSVRFEMAKFYVSEIALVDSTGRSHYLLGTHLVDMLDSASQARGYAVVTVKALPGRYSGIRFSVGVPYDQNHRDAATQPAPLGTESGMFWSWNSGYIFHRIEGKIDSAGVEKPFVFHIGADNRKVQVSLYSLTATTTTFTVAGAHVKAAAAKVAHEVETQLPINVTYNSLFTTGLNTTSALKPSLNTSERTAHGGAIADRIFLNMQPMFALAAGDVADTSGAHAH